MRDINVVVFALFNIYTLYQIIHLWKKCWIDFKLVFVSQIEGIQFLSRNLGYPFLRYTPPRYPPCKMLLEFFVIFFSFLCVLWKSQKST